MKTFLKKIIKKSILQAKNEGLINHFKDQDIEIEETKNEKYGDYSTNLAMKVAKKERKSPLEIAKIIIKKIKKNKSIKKIKIENPGFINFFIEPSSWVSVLKKIYKEDNKYGHCNIGNGKRVQVEFVSSNPTGPLHFGHGRGAVIGDTMANIFKVCGYKVEKEYYINDFGKQIAILGLSVFLRAKELLGYKIKFPEYCYQGSYIKSMAKELLSYIDHSKILEKKKRKKLLKRCSNFSLNKILEKIKSDLKNLGVYFDNWFYESDLYKTKKTKNAIKNFIKAGLIYKKNNALWFKTSMLGDEKDRVVVKKNGNTTYFASDIAYHKDKFDRGFDLLINVWGADHHGYIPRIKAIIKALDKDKNQLKIILVKLVNLLKNNKKVSMSTRSGKFITLSDVIKEVGKDATRFIFLTRNSNSHLNFDIQLAKKKTNENPVYYVQYVYARISSILLKAKKKGISTKKIKSIKIKKIENKNEIKLIKNLEKYPEIIRNCCFLMEPHRITFYLIDLSSNFHAYYNNNRILNKNKKTTMERLYLIIAVSKVIKNALHILGINAPKKM